MNWFGIGMAALFISAFIILIVITDIKGNKLRKLYPPVSCQDSIHGKVQAALYNTPFTAPHQHRFIVIDNKKMFVSTDEPAIEDAEDVELGDVLHPQAHLYKEQGSDTLIIQYNQKMYKYIIYCID